MAYPPVPGAAGISTREAASAVESYRPLTVPLAVNPVFPVPGVVERAGLARKGRASAADNGLKELLAVGFWHFDQANEKWPPLVVVDGERCQEVISCHC